MSLFKFGKIKLHSGEGSFWKVECDALGYGDWDCLARMYASEHVFSEVEGVPRGGVKFADALTVYRQLEPGHGLLIADDVFTTGASMEEHRDGREAKGVVAFARSTPPPWVKALWSFGL